MAASGPGSPQLWAVLVVDRVVRGPTGPTPSVVVDLPGLVLQGSPQSLRGDHDVRVVAAAPFRLFIVDGRPILTTAGQHKETGQSRQDDTDPSHEVNLVPTRKSALGRGPMAKPSEMAWPLREGIRVGHWAAGRILSAPVVLDP